jgi:hypothetical protein
VFAEQGKHDGLMRLLVAHRLRLVRSHEGAIAGIAAARIAASRRDTLSLAYILARHRLTRTHLSTKLA